MLGALLFGVAAWLWRYQVRDGVIAGMLMFAGLRVVASYRGQGSLQASLVQLNATSAAPWLSRLVGRCVLLLFYALHVPLALTLGQFIYVWKHSRLMWLSIAMTLQLLAVVMAFLSTIGAWKWGWLQASTSGLLMATATAVIVVLANTAKIFYDIEDKACIQLFGSACFNGSFEIVNTVLVPVETLVLAWVVYCVLGGGLAICCFKVWPNALDRCSKSAGTTCSAPTWP